MKPCSPLKTVEWRCEGGEDRTRGCAKRSASSLPGAWQASPTKITRRTSALSLSLAPSPNSAPSSCHAPLFFFFFFAAMLLAPAAFDRPVTGHHGGLAAPEVAYDVSSSYASHGGSSALRRLFSSSSSQVNQQRLKTSSLMRETVDPTYYFVLLKEKQKLIQKEISQFHVRLELLELEAEQVPSLRRRRNELSRSIEEAQGEIATINLAVTQGRENLSPEEIQQTARNLQKQNEEKVRARSLENACLSPGEKEKKEETDSAGKFELASPVY